LILSFFQEINSLQVMITFMGILAHLLSWKLRATNTTTSNISINTIQSVIEWKLAFVKILKSLRIESSWVLQLTLISSTDHVFRVVVNQVTLCVLSQDFLLQVLIVINKFMFILCRSNWLLKRIEVTDMLTPWNIIMIS
jgi:hypothetical protein